VPGQPERIKVTNRVIRLLRTLPRTKFIKMPGGPMLEAGTPDIFALVQGTLVCIECKVPGNAPTPIQLHRLAEWSTAGAVGIVAYSEDDVRRALLDAGKSLV
jgi:Holliday junction resolvase